MKPLVYLFVSIVLFAATTPSALALPIIFTDRAAFNAVVGETTQVTFSSPVVFTPHTNPDGTKNFDFGTGTVDDLLMTGGDREIFVGMNDIPGAFCFCSTFGAGGFGLGTINPVLAFGVDITPLQPNAVISFVGSKFVLTEPQFLGVLYSEPTFSGIGQTFGLTSPEPSRFFIDNVAIRTVPEPASLLFLGFGALCLIACNHARRRFVVKVQLERVVGMAAGLVLWCVPTFVEAAQIAPNPNPSGSTIDIVNDPTAVNNDPFTNWGTINIDDASVFTNNGGLENNGQITNAGTVNNVAGAGISNIGGNLTNAVGGTLNNYGGIFGLLAHNAVTNAGTLNNHGSVSVSLSSIANSGTLNNLSGASFEIHDGGLGNSLGGTVTNHGTVSTVFAGLGNSGTLINFGSWTARGPSTITNSLGATLANYGSMSVGAGSGGFGLSNAGTMINNGNLEFEREGLHSTGTLINNGTITITLSVASSVGIGGGSLRGTGTINAPVGIASGAILSPGDATALGKLNIYGNLESSGNVLFRIQGLSVGQFDVLDISGDANFNGGTMSFAFTGFDPKIGNSWDFLYASAISGWDSLTFLFSGLDSTERAQFYFHDGIRTLRIVAVPEPGSIFLLSAGVVGFAGCRKIFRSAFRREL